MKKNNLVGKKFNRLTLVKKAESKKGRRAMYLFRCDCGNLKNINLSDVKSNNTKSCGCLKSEMTSARRKTHGMTGTRLHNIWVNMRQRCTNKNWSNYNRYGERGIKVCDNWLDFNNFKNWALSNGYKDSLSIDRIDNDGNYCPENCRFATPKEQARNTSTNHFVKFNGKRKTLAEWSEITGFSRETISKRIEAGWRLKDVFNCPLNANPKYLISFKGKTRTINQWSKVLGININTLRSRLRKWSVEEAFSKKVESKYRSN